MVTAFFQRRRDERLPIGPFMIPVEGFIRVFGLFAFQQLFELFVRRGEIKNLTVRRVDSRFLFLRFDDKRKSV